MMTMKKKCIFLLGCAFFFSVCLDLPLSGEHEFDGFNSLSTHGETRLGALENISTSTFRSAQPRKRDITPEAWNAAVQKGIWLLCQMQMDLSDGVEQSTWTDTNQLGDYGWVAETDPAPPVDKLEAFDALRDAQMSFDSHDWVNGGWMHTESYNIDDVDWKPTEGQYLMYLNLRQGAIYSAGSYSPDYMISLDSSWRRPYYPDPFLKRRSDVTFLSWQLYAQSYNTDMRNLRYYIGQDVVNTETNNIIKEAQRRVGPIYGRAQIFTMDSEEGKAILGSPNAWGKAFLLSMHKTQLGVKTISKIAIYAQEDPSEAFSCHMMYYVEDVPGVN